MLGWLLKRYYLSVLRDTQSTTYQGFHIYGDPLFPSRQPSQIDAIRSALQVLASVDPRRYKRSQIHATTIVAAERGGSSYRRWVPAITIRTGECEAWQIAKFIVHETTHALLDSKGIRYRRSVRHRIERICEAESARFAARYFSMHMAENDEDRQRLTDHLVKTSTEGLEEQWWTLSKRLKNALKTNAETGERLSVDESSEAGDLGSALEDLSMGLEKLAPGDFEGAIDHFTRVLKADRVDENHKHQALTWRGVARMEVGDLSGAAADFTAVLAMEGVSGELRETAQWRLQECKWGQASDVQASDGSSDVENALADIRGLHGQKD